MHVKRQVLIFGKRNTYGDPLACYACVPLFIRRSEGGFQHKAMHPKCFFAKCRRRRDHRFFLPIKATLDAKSRFWSSVGLYRVNPNQLHHVKIIIRLDTFFLTYLLLGRFVICSVHCKAIELLFPFCIP